MRLVFGPRSAVLENVLFIAMLYRCVDGVQHMGVDLVEPFRRSGAFRSSRFCNCILYMATLRNMRREMVINVNFGQRPIALHRYC